MHRQRLPGLNEVLRLLMQNDQIPKNIYRILDCLCEPTKKRPGQAIGTGRGSWKRSAMIWNGDYRRLRPGRAQTTALPGGRIHRSSRRQGLAIIWALVVMATVSTVSAVSVAQSATARRQTDMFRNRIRAGWLAHTGCELAASRLLANPDGYMGETATPIPASKVKITVSKDVKDKNIFRIESEARYPDNERNSVVKTERRSLKRIEDEKGVRVECIE